mgnify:CR=1 FL=1
MTTRNIQKYEEFPDYPKAQFLSDIGGAAGLCLGMSFASLIGIIDCLLSYVIRWIRMACSFCSFSSVIRTFSVVGANIRMSQNKLGRRFSRHIVRDDELDGTTKECAVSLAFKSTIMVTRWRLTNIFNLNTFDLSNHFNYFYV